MAYKEQKMRFFFTFGSDHAFPDGYVVIYADNSYEARQHMFSLFGTKWAFQYDDSVDTLKMVLKHGLYRVATFTI